MNQKALYNSNYTYDADGQRSIKYVPEGLGAHYSAKDAGRQQHLATMLYPSPLLTVEALDLPTEDELPPDIDEPTLQALNNYHLTRYTKHYFIGSERLNSTIGSRKNLGVLCEPIYGTISREIVMEMNNKVEKAGSALTEDYTAFGKEANLDKPYLYFDNEYLTFCGEALPDRYAAFWFHPDHLGSSNYITDLNGNVSQHLEYFPFGETLVEEHKNSNNSPYKFNAKELDDETGNYYYGARYYSSKYNLMLSVDPASEIYPSFSPYAYTLQNPVKYVDPTGMVVESPDNEYKINKNGEVELVKPTNEEFDVLYNSNMSQGMQFDKNTFGKIENTTFKTKRELADGKIESEEHKVQLIDVSHVDSEEAQMIFEFIAQSSINEISIQKFKNGKSFIGTSFDQEGEMSTALTIHRHGELTAHDHSHREFLLSPSPVDIDIAKTFKGRGWNTKLRLYSPETKKYQDYNHKSSSITLEPVIFNMDK